MAPCPGHREDGYYKDFRDFHQQIGRYPQGGAGAVEVVDQQDGLVMDDGDV